MASRQRQSTATANTPRPSAPSELPPYEPPSHPLNTAAQRALASLERTHSLAKLKQHLQRAKEDVTAAAGDINDRLYITQTTHYKRTSAKRTLSDRDEDDQTKSSQELEEMQTRVDNMTQRMERSIRHLIDAQQHVESLERTLRKVQHDTTTAAAASTQAATQRSTQHLGGPSTAASEHLEDFDPTAPGASHSGSAAPTRGPSTLFTSRLQADKDAFESLPLRTRYAEHNDYVGFKRLVHDAQNPTEDAAPLAHPSTWFAPVGGSPAPGITEGTKRGDAAEESDDDVAIARERISTKCPLTLKEFGEPVTSRKCPHTFEKEAILELVRGSSTTVGGGRARGGRGGGERAVRCPVSGCTEVRPTACSRSHPHESQTSTDSSRKWYRCSRKPISTPTPSSSARSAAYSSPAPRAADHLLRRPLAAAPRPGAPSPLRRTRAARTSMRLSGGRRGRSRLCRRRRGVRAGRRRGGARRLWIWVAVRMRRWDDGLGLILW